MTQNTHFEQYLNEFNEICTAITRLLEQANSQRGEKRKETIRKASLKLDEVKELLDMMSVELQATPPAARSGMSPLFNRCKAEYAKLNKDLNVLGFNNERQELLQVDQDSTQIQTDQRARLLAANARLEKSTQRLQDSIRLTDESREAGESILENLRAQRQQINRVRDKMDEAEAHIDKSNVVLTKMQRRSQFPYFSFF